MTEVIKYLEEIKEHQMQTVELARITEVYKLADKALKAINVIQCCATFTPAQIVKVLDDCSGLIDAKEYFLDENL